MNIFFDMDGVLGIYERDAYAAPDFKWKQPGAHYFAHVEPDKKAVELFDMLSDTPGVSTFVLTAVLNSGPICMEQIQDKLDWAQKHLRNFDAKKQFIPTVSLKTRTIQAMLFQNRNNMLPSDILIDDYNPNLKAWQDAGGTGMKYLNGINHASSWKGIVLTKDMSAKDICDLIQTLAQTALFNKHY